MIRQPPCTFVLLLFTGCNSLLGIGNPGLVGGDAPTVDAPLIGDGVAADAAPPEFLSCLGIGSTCGSSGTNTCCDSPMVTGGLYDRSFDEAGDASSGDMTAPATVSDFRLDKYEVTVGRFRQFVLAGKGTQAHPPDLGAGAHVAIANSGWQSAFTANLTADTPALLAAIKCGKSPPAAGLLQTWVDSPGSNDTENRPMNCITWFEAMAFCIWDGGYLPTEAEWNYAATGGNLQRAYPWSDPASSLLLDGTHASFSINNGVDCVGDGMAGCALTDLVEVGTKPAGDGFYGQSDLAGNVFEWVLDIDGPYPSPCSDCANLTTGNGRGIRGGSFFDDAIFIRSGFRTGFGPQSRSAFIGVRCARPLNP